jgi:hypothetical protein
MSYTIIKPGDGSSLDPMKLLNQYTLLQTALLSLFPFGSSEYLRIQASHPGEELLAFQSLFASSKKPVTLKDERGIRLSVRTLDADAIVLVKYALASVYEKAAKSDLSIYATLTNLYHQPTTKFLLFQPTPVSSTAEVYSFLYDGGIVGNKGKIRKDTTFVFHEALMDAAKHSVIEAEMDDFSPMTPVQIQTDIIQSLQKQLKLVPEKNEEGQWEFRFEKEVAMEKFIPVALQTNQGFLRATHPGMILPEISPFALVKQIQTIGEQIVNVTVPLLPESKEVEETPEEDIPELRIGTVPIIRNKDATGFSMISQYAIGTFIPELLPPL